MEQTSGFEGRTKKEILGLTREKNKPSAASAHPRHIKVPPAIQCRHEQRAHCRR